MDRSLNIRIITPADFEQYANLSNSAFGVPVESERKVLNRINPEQILVAEVDGEIIAQLFIHRLGVWVNGRLLSLGGIGGVTTSKNHRQKGYATMLLQKTLEHMHKVMGCTMSALYPTTYSLYHRCGWVIADKGCMFTASPSSFGLFGNSKSSDYRIEHRAVRPDDLKLLQSIRRCYAIATQGFIERDKLGWQLRILGLFSEKNPERCLVLHYDGQPHPDGYLIYEPKENNTVEVLEFIYNSPASFDGLLSFIAENLSQTNVSMWLSAETPLLSRVVNPLAFQITCDPSRQAMYRIVDVASALSSRSMINSKVSGELTLQVIDRMVGWNDGSWSIDIEKGNVQCKKSQTLTNPDVILDIQTLTQLFFGYCSMKSVVTSGFVQISRPEALNLLSEFFESQSSPFSGEHF